MACIINADNGAISGSAGVKTTADSTGVLNIQTNGTTAISISASQAVSFTNTPTFTGGTANGVLYLNGSKVATSGSALTFDGTNLALAGGNAATQKINIYASGSTAQYLAAGNSNTGLNGTLFGVDGTGNAVINNTQAFGVIFSTSNTERMRLDSSGNLGIGTANPGTFGKFASVAASGATSVYTGTGVQGLYITTNESTRVVRYDSSGSLTGLHAWGNGPSELMRLDSSGNLGLGVTPSGWTTFTSALEVPGGALAGISANQVGVWQNCFYNSSSFKYKSTAAATLYQQAGAVHAWYNAASGTAGNTISFTQAMTLDADGELGVGTTSPTARVHAYSSTAMKQITVDGAGAIKTGINFASGGTTYGQIYFDNNSPYDMSVLQQYTTGSLIFGTNNTERARITSGGYSKFSNTGAYQDSAGSYHEFRSNGAAGEYTAIIGNSTSTDANAFGVRILYGNADPNGTGNQFLNCADWNGSSIVTRAEIRSNGGLANYSANDVNLSDERTKKDIVPLGSMWDKFKAIEIVAFKYKDQTHEDNNIGVIAQQVESVAPEFVDVDGFGDTPEDGVPLKTVYTTDMYHAAIKALQEAMTRIEQLEAKVATLETK